MQIYKSNLEHNDVRLITAWKAEKWMVTEILIWKRPKKRAKDIL